MSLTEEQKRRIEEEESAKLSNTAYNQTHGVPALLSLFIPGLGQMTKGQTGKGILIFFGTIFGYIMLVIPGIIIHLWQVADAYND